MISGAFPRRAIFTVLSSAGAATSTTPVADQILAVVEVYENLQTKTVQPERKIRLADFARRSRLFKFDFHGKDSAWTSAFIGTSNVFSM